MNVDDLEKLARLKESGAISEVEFEQGKRKLLAEYQGIPNAREDKFGLADTTYYMLMHLSQLCSFLVPFSGIVVAVVLWILNKDKDPVVDAQGKNILNWNISIIVYFLAGLLLFFAFIGPFFAWIPIFLLIPIPFAIIFSIFGAVKANRGEVWRYPLSIPFF